MRMKAISARKVLIRAPNWVGDAVMAEPSLRRLRDVFSHAHLTILAPPSVTGLYEGEGLADEIVVAGGKGVRILARESRLLRQHRFDLAVLLQNAFSAALLARASGIRKVAGYPTDGRRLLLDPVIPLDRNHKTNHQVFYYMKIASFIESAVAGQAATDPAGDEQSLSVDAITPRLRAAPEATDRAFRLLKQELTRGRPSHSDDAPLLVLNPGATNSRAKRWLPDRFADLADQLSRQVGFQTVIIGVAGDIELCQAVAERMETRGAVLAGKTDTADLKGLLSQAALVVSNDTGSAHVAAALGIPTIVIFGPTEHFVTRPYSHNAQVVRHQVECSPCMLRDCPIDHRCMTGVQVSDVREAVERLMALKVVPAGVNSVAHT
jgi:heptosyltransferase-2